MTTHHARIQLALVLGVACLASACTTTTDQVGADAVSPESTAASDQASPATSRPTATDPDGQPIFDFAPATEQELDFEGLTVTHDPQECRTTITAEDEAITFRHDSAELTPTSHAVIASIAKSLEPEEVVGAVRIEGHTSTRGPAAYNEQLSQDRADAVAELLRRDGPPVIEYEPRGLGEAQPKVDPERTAADEARNRRVVISYETTACE